MQRLKKYAGKAESGEVPFRAWSHILLRRRRPKSMRREATFSFSNFPQELLTESSAMTENRFFVQMAHLIDSIAVDHMA